MSKIIFKTISVRNFLSVGNVPITVDLNTGARTLFIGPNGVGKSAIFNAIFWCLFNEGIENTIKQDDFINYANERGTEVILTLTIGKDEYVITRTRKPNNLKLEINGLPSTAHSSANFDEELVKLMGMDAEIARNTLVLDANTTPFMKMKGPEQRSFMERLLTLFILTDRAKILKQKQNENLVALKVEESRIELLIRTNAQTQVSISTLETKSNEWQREYDQKLLQLEQNLEQLVSLDINAGLKHYTEIERLEAEWLQPILRTELDTKQHLRESINTLAKTIRQIQTSSENWEINKQKQSETFQKRLDDIQRLSPDTHIVRFEELKQLRTSLKALQTEIGVLEYKYNEQQTKIQRLLKMKIDLENGVCPTCGQLLHNSINAKIIKEIETLPALESEQNIISSALSRSLNGEQEFQRNITVLEEHNMAGPKSLEECHSLLIEQGQLEFQLSQFQTAINPNMELLVTKQKEYRQFPDLQNLETEIKTLTQEFNLAVLKKKEIRDQLDSLKSLSLPPKREYEMAAVKIAALEDQYQELQKQSNPYRSQLETLKASLQPVLYTELAHLKKLDDHYDLLIKLLTDNKGFLRKNLVSMFTPYINKRINHYLMLFQSPHIAEINSDLTTTLLYQSRYPTGYGNASKGQKLRLNFATNRAFRDLMLMFGKNYNLTMVDEYFDSGGDKAFFHQAFDIMQHEHDTVFIISHREDLLKMVDKSIGVSLENGYTKLTALNS